MTDEHAVLRECRDAPPISEDEPIPLSPFISAETHAYIAAILWEIAGRVDRAAQLSPGRTALYWHLHGIVGSHIKGPK